MYIEPGVIEKFSLVLATALPSCPAPLQRGAAAKLSSSCKQQHNATHAISVPASCTVRQTLLRRLVLATVLPSCPFHSMYMQTLLIRLTLAIAPFGGHLESEM
jgi:hypothetical protein